MTLKHGFYTLKTLLRLFTVTTGNMQHCSHDDMPFTSHFFYVGNYTH